MSVTKISQNKSIVYWCWSQMVLESDVKLSPWRWRMFPKKVAESLRTWPWFESLRTWLRLLLCFQPQQACSYQPGTWKQTCRQHCSSPQCELGQLASFPIRVMTKFWLFCKSCKPGNLLYAWKTVFEFQKLSCEIFQNLFNHLRESMFSTHLCL